jgi:LacI family transcriptional regulator/LacI family repressor for deo operon, udp, cdd, tsx, nupC, and nupG
MAVLRDVAEKAGVSTATVSRVLNNAPNVNPETRSRVEKAIKALNFKPSRVAQRLRIKDGHRKMIGLVVPDIQNPFYVEVVRGVEDKAYANNYALLMCNFAQDEIKEKLYLDIMKSESVDGLIVAPVHERDKDVQDLVLSGLPIVCVDRGLSDLDVDVVLVDNEQGAYDAVNYLIKLGHTRIAYIGGLPTIPTSRQRRMGYESALKDNNLKLDESLIKFGDSKHESGKVLAGELLQMKDPPTALFTGNNLITLGALETIHSRGLNVPNDISILGFDDMPWSISLNPPLTAVSQPGYEIGRRAADMLFQRIAEPEQGSAKIVLKTKLIIRQSCSEKKLKMKNGKSGWE